MAERRVMTPGPGLSMSARLLTLMVAGTRRCSSCSKLRCPLRGETRVARRHEADVRRNQWRNRLFMEAPFGKREVKRLAMEKLLAKGAARAPDIVATDRKSLQGF